MSLFRKVPNGRTDVRVNKVDKHVHTNIFRIFNILESREVAFLETSLTSQTLLNNPRQRRHVRRYRKSIRC